MVINTQSETVKTFSSDRTDLFPFDLAEMNRELEKLSIQHSNRPLPFLLTEESPSLEQEVKPDNHIKARAVRFKRISKERKTK